MLLGDACAAALAMALVGGVDAITSGAGSPLPGAHIVVFVVSWHLAFGFLVGAVTGLGRPCASLLDRVVLRAWRSGSGLMMAGLAFGVVGGALMCLWIYYAGIEFRALPWHLLLPCVVFLLPFLALSKVFEHFIEPNRHGRIALTLCLAFTLGLVGASRHIRQDGSIPHLLTRTITPRLAIEQGRAFFDEDNDGYPTRFCQSDCDCDDLLAGVNPGSVETMDNDRDEDCDGRDLKRADIRTVFGASPATLPSQEGLRHSQGVVPRQNVLLIVVDTLRADHLGLHGYPRNTSPRLDALSRRGVVFTQARAQGSMTRESLAPILTGRYYTELARDDVKWPTFFPENIFVAEMLRDAGYRTWGVSSFIYVTPLYGFDQGLGTLDTTILRTRSKVHWNRTSDLVTDLSLKQIDAWPQDDSPFFILAHYADPHSGYQRHAESPRFGGFTADIYDEEIFFTDLQIGRLFDGLEARGLLDETLVILTSDHGEGLRRSDDHGHIYHGQTLYDNLIHVPLIAWAPGTPGRRVDVPVATIDIVPTILALNGVQHPGPLSGVSLVPWLRGDSDATHPPVVSQKFQPRRDAKLAMVQWPHKVIWNIPLNTWEVYDLRHDPDETRNLVHANPPPNLARLKFNLKAWRATIGEQNSAGLKRTP